jgi:hypothetical protein
MLLSKFPRHCAPTAILLMLTSTSMSYGMTAPYFRHQLKRERGHLSLRFMVPDRDTTDERYQPQRSPGYHEDFRQLRTIAQGTEQMEKNDAGAQKNCLGRTAARISIVILALGFTLLRYLSLINKHQVCAGNAISFENGLSINMSKALKEIHRLYNSPHRKALQAGRYQTDKRSAFKKDIADLPAAIDAFDHVLQTEGRKPNGTVSV